MPRHPLFTDQVRAALQQLANEASLLAKCHKMARADGNAHMAARYTSLRLHTLTMLTRARRAAIAQAAADARLDWLSEPDL